MTIRPFDFTTGQSTVPDVGVLSYNGCIFSPLFETNVSGRCVQDEAQRTTMYMLYTITVDGYVTPTEDNKITITMADLKFKLSQHAGELRYEGRGNDIVVNVPGGKNKDVKWGPVPKILEFQPLGGGKTAKVKWTVEVAIVELGFDGLTGPGLKTGGGRRIDIGRDSDNIDDILGGSGGGPGGGGGGGSGNFLDGVVKPGPAAAFGKGR